METSRSYRNFCNYEVDFPNLTLTLLDGIYILLTNKSDLPARIQGNLSVDKHFKLMEAYVTLLDMGLDDKEIKMKFISPENKTEVIRFGIKKPIDK